MKLDVMYPKQAEALIKAGLVTKDFPTLEEMGKEIVNKARCKKNLNKQGN